MKTEPYSSFEPASASRWKETIQRDLKGEPFDSLVWHNDNGFDVQPFYTGEDRKTPSYPAFSHASWIMSARPLVNDALVMNKRLLHLLEKGATGIGAGYYQGQMGAVLSGIQLDIISSTFYAPAAGLHEISELLKKDYAGKSPDVKLIATGIRSENDIKTWLSAAAPLAQHGTSVVGIDASAWSNAGALEYYELALAFTALVSWLDLAPKELTHKNRITIRTTVNADLFTQIAKLRAYRRLWEVFREEFDLHADLYIVAETSLATMAVTDDRNNMIRSTIECFAAVCGGCNELVAHPHDALLSPGAESERLALNQQLILREECFLSHVADVGCGSYYIESLTDQLAEKALATFKTIQKKGGYAWLLQNGEAEKEISRQAQVLTERVRREEQLLVGVNRFRQGNSSVPDLSPVLFLLTALGVNNPAVMFETIHAEKP
jgi:methylmalonyl-CoA mutase